MNLDLIAQNFTSAPVLFFILGLISVALRSELEIPPALAKFFSLYLLFDIGIKGGSELFRSGFGPEILSTMRACILVSLTIPVVAFFILRKKLDIYNAGAIAATYGSVSAVTFATCIGFLQSQSIPFNGYMVAGMAMMESPAIIMGLLLIRVATKQNNTSKQEGASREKTVVNSSGFHFPFTLVEMKNLLAEAMFNGSVLLLLGSLVIGYLIGEKGEKELNPFVGDIYKGMLCFYLLDMGLIAGHRLKSLKNNSLFLVSFGILFPIFNGILGMAIAWGLGLTIGNALLFTILCASASYIAVPAAIRMSVPEANIGLLMPLSLGVTFTFNIAFGIPLYYSVIAHFWK